MLAINFMSDSALARLPVISLTFWPRSDELTPGYRYSANLKASLLGGNAAVSKVTKFRRRTDLLSDRCNKDDDGSQGRSTAGPSFLKGEGGEGLARP